MRKALFLLLIASPAMGQSAVGLGYVLDHPLPVLAGVSDEDFTEGVSIGARWQAFDNEGAMLQALAQGDISVAIGVSPEGFLDAVNGSIDLQIVDIAAVFSEQWNCVLRDDVAQSKAALFGLNVALPFASGADFVFETQMTALGGDLGSAVRSDLAPTDAAAAFARGDAQIGCGFGAALARMREGGVDLMGSEATFDLGARWFSAVVVTDVFAGKKPAAIANFINEQKALDGSLSAIASAADMGEIDAEAALAGQRILTTDEKFGADWFGGGLQEYLTNLASLRAKRGLFEKDIAAVADRINANFLTQH